MQLSWFREADASVERGCRRSRGSEGRKAASHDLGAGRRWPSLGEGEVGKSISPLLLLPPLQPSGGGDGGNKYKSLFNGPALHFYQPPTPSTHRTQERAHGNKRGGGERQSHQPGASLQLGLGAWVSGQTASEHEGRGFLWAPLPRPCLLQSGAAASLAPCAPGPRDSHHLPPAPAPSSGLPGPEGAGAR